MESLKAKDYMQSRPITFTADMMVQAAVEKFLNSHQLGGPVVDGQGHLIGWISEQDCIAVLLKEAYHCEQVAQVKDVMRKEVLSVGPDTSILSLAEMMMGQKPKIYPVVEEGVCSVSSIATTSCRPFTPSSPPVLSITPTVNPVFLSPKASFGLPWLFHMLPFIHVMPSYNGCFVMFEERPISLSSHI